MKMEMGIFAVQTLNMIMNAKPLSFRDSPHLSPSPFSVYLSGRLPLIFILTKVDPSSCSRCTQTARDRGRREGWRLKAASEQKPQPNIKVESLVTAENGETSFLGEFRGHHDLRAESESRAKPWHHGAALQPFQGHVSWCYRQRSGVCCLHPLPMRGLTAPIFHRFKANWENCV